jgi:acetyltransferase-like isoleucine patch superfamily enzyme
MSLAITKTGQIPRYKPSKLEIYGWWGLLKLTLNFIRTKISIPKARLIRFPIEIRGKRHICFGKGLTTGKGCRIEAYPYINRDTIIYFGNNIEINDYVHITGINRITIGDNVLMASKIYISDSNHGSYKGTIDDTDPETIARSRKVTGEPIFIEDNVWLGESVSVLSGVKIGRCSIVGANSVVTHNLPPFTISVGNPAKPIKIFDFTYKKWVKYNDRNE